MVKTKKTKIHVERIKDSAEYCNFNVTKTTWSEKEKKKLLAALKKYGYTDIDNISKEFPMKSKITLKTMIKKLRLAAGKCATKRESQIDIWLNSGLFHENDSVIPQALKFISLFEKHPSPETTNYDFKMLYDVLSRATRGDSLVDVPQAIREEISSILLQATHEIWPRQETEICEYVDNLVHESLKNSYPAKKRS